MPGRRRVKTLRLDILAQGKNEAGNIEGNPLHMETEMTHQEGESGIEEIGPQVRQYLHELLDSFLDRLNDSWNSVMSPPPTAALIVAQVMGEIPQELSYLMNDKDPVTKILSSMNEKWIALAQLRDGTDGDLLANEFMEDSIQEIEKVRPKDPILPLMKGWLEEGKKFVTSRQPVKPQYLN